jgi:hypothetical protein
VIDSGSANHAHALLGAGTSDLHVTNADTKLNPMSKSEILEQVPKLRRDERREILERVKFSKRANAICLR